LCISEDVSGNNRIALAFVTILDCGLIIGPASCFRRKQGVITTDWNEQSVDLDYVSKTFVTLELAFILGLLNTLFYA
jgi:hypothetical protein